ncbi:MAG: hypothetical protein U5Q03_00855 [Bacteroidota bacterium]|nr:hypothetical protein [Bacteroidota bacterium]
MEVKYPFSHIAGGGFSKAIIKMILNEKVEKNLLSKQKTGTTSVKEIYPVKFN